MKVWSRTRWGSSCAPDRVRFTLPATPPGDHMFIFSAAGSGIKIEKKWPVRLWDGEDESLKKRRSICRLSFLIGLTSAMGRYIMFNKLLADLFWSFPCRCGSAIFLTLWWTGKDWVGDSVGVSTTVPTVKFVIERDWFNGFFCSLAAGDKERRIPLDAFHLFSKYAAFRVFPRFSHMKHCHRKEGVLFNLTPNLERLSDDVSVLSESMSIITNWSSLFIPQKFGIRRLSHVTWYIFVSMDPWIPQIWRKGSGDILFQDWTQGTNIDVHAVKFRRNWG